VGGDGGVGSFTVTKPPGIVDEAVLSLGETTEWLLLNDCVEVFSLMLPSTLPSWLVTLSLRSCSGEVGDALVALPRVLSDAIVEVPSAASPSRDMAPLGARVALDGLRDGNAGVGRGPTVTTRAPELALTT